MHNQIITDRLLRISESCELIHERTKNLERASDLVSQDDDAMLLDSIALRLQVIGEHVKKIDTLDDTIFEMELKLDPDPIIRFRDFIAHHYEKTDYEIIFDIVRSNLPELKQKINLYLKNVS